MNHEMRHQDAEDGGWVVSSFSPPNNCVQLRFVDAGGVQVRDSKDPLGAVLEFSRTEWEAFLLGAFHGEFGRG